MLKRQEIPYYTSIMFIYKSSKCKVSENTQPEVIGKQMRLTINNLLNETKFIQRNIYKNKYQEVESWMGKWRYVLSNVEFEFLQ
jgi:hypothetical protein